MRIAGLPMLLSILVSGCTAAPEPVLTEARLSSCVVGSGEPGCPVAPRDVAAPPVDGYVDGGVTLTDPQAWRTTAEGACAPVSTDVIDTDWSVRLRGSPGQELEVAALEPGTTTRRGCRFGFSVGYTDGSLESYDLELGPLTLRTLEAEHLSRRQEVRLP